MGAIISARLLTFMLSLKSRSHGPRDKFEEKLKKVRTSGCVPGHRVRRPIDPAL